MKNHQEELKIDIESNESYLNRRSLIFAGTFRLSSPVGGFTLLGGTRHINKDFSDPMLLKSYASHVILCGVTKTNILQMQ